MAFQIGRWLKYAQARLAGSVEAADRELDELEAQRAAEVADRPWLADDGPVPTLDQVKARIDAEADAQQRAGRSEESAPPAGERGPSTTATNDPDLTAAQLELDRRSKEASARLEAIRAELGVEPPGGPDAEA